MEEEPRLFLWKLLIVKNTLIPRYENIQNFCVVRPQETSTYGAG